RRRTRKSQYIKGTGAECVSRKIRRELDRFPAGGLEQRDGRPAKPLPERSQFCHRAKISRSGDRVTVSPARSPHPQRCAQGGRSGLSNNETIRVVVTILDGAKPRPAAYSDVIWLMLLEVVTLLKHALLPGSI